MAIKMFLLNIKSNEGERESIKNVNNRHSISLGLIISIDVYKVKIITWQSNLSLGFNRKKIV